MNTLFLERLLRLALQVTRAERGMAVEATGAVCAMVGLDEATINTPKFKRIAEKCLTDSLTRDEVILTNNVITDPSEAPVTNTSFSDLRAVVAIPLGSIGALYLDQPIRQGIISRESIDRVQEFALRLIVEERTDLEESELKALYSASSAET